MAVTLHHNITGENTTKLVSAGDNTKISSISLANVHGSLPCSIDLFIKLTKSASETPAVDVILS